MIHTSNTSHCFCIEAETIFLQRKAGKIHLVMPDGSYCITVKEDSLRLLKLSTNRQKCKVYSEKAESIFFQIKYGGYSVDGRLRITSPIFKMWCPSNQYPVLWSLQITANPVLCFDLGLSGSVQKTPFMPRKKYSL